MTVPTAPTLDDLCAEGIKKAGYSSGTTQYTALIARAKATWIEEIKNDIATMSKELKPLQGTYAHITIPNRARYQMPSDYSSTLKMTLLEGEHYGTAQTGTDATITLEATEDIESEFILGKYVVITGGEGPNQIAQVIEYDETTKIATIYAETIDGKWITTPDATSTYLVCDEVYDLKYMSIDKNDTHYETDRAEPIAYILADNQNTGEFRLWPSPYRTDTGQTKYIVLQRYFADVMLLDASGGLITRLYRKWRNIFVQGFYFKALSHKNDDRAEKEETKFYTLLKLAIIKEIPFPDSDDFISNSIG